MGYFPATTAGKDIMAGSNAAAQRTSLGLGSIATQAANSVSITGGSISGVSGLALAKDWETKSSGFTAAVGKAYELDTSGGAVQADLPALAGLAEDDEIIFKLVTAGNTFTADGNGAEGIDGAPTATMTVAGECMILRVGAGLASWRRV